MNCILLVSLLLFYNTASSLLVNHCFVHPSHSDHSKLIPLLSIHSLHSQPIPQSHLHTDSFLHRRTSPASNNQYHSLPQSRRLDTFQFQNSHQFRLRGASDWKTTICMDFESSHRYNSAHLCAQFLEFR